MPAVGSPLANRRSIEGSETSCWSPISSPLVKRRGTDQEELVKRRSVEIGGSPLSRRKQEANLEVGGDLEVGRAARDSPVLLLASLDKSILQIRLGV